MAKATLPKLKQLGRLRIARSMTQERLAELSGVARSTIAELEAENRPARWSTQRKLAEALGVSVETLVRNSPRKSSKGASAESETD